MANKRNPLWEFVSPEDLALVKARTSELNAPTTNARRKAIHYDTRHGRVLKPWMLAYAEWLISEPTEPRLSAKRAEINQLAKCIIADQARKALESRADFLAYCEEIQKGPIEEARAKYMRRLPKYIEAREQALDAAVAAGDYKAVDALTISAVDRVMPKHDQTVQNTQINVVLTPQRLAGFTEYTPVEIETVPDEPAA